MTEHEREQSEDRLSPLDEVWMRANDNERFGMQFGLFPIWVQEYGLTREAHAKLIVWSREYEGKEEAQ